MCNVWTFLVTLTLLSYSFNASRKRSNKRFVTFTKVTNVCCYILQNSNKHSQSYDKHWPVLGLESSECPVAALERARQPLYKALTALLFLYSYVWFKYFQVICSYSLMVFFVKEPAYLFA